MATDPHARSPRCSRRGSWVFALAMLVIAAAGCKKSGLETAEVRGTITIDGAPVTRGTVMFVPPAGRAGHGIIQPNGSFYVTTYQDGDGAVVGENKISVIVPFDENATPADVAKHRLPIKYATTSSSGLACDVKPGEVNEVHLELKSN